MFVCARIARRKEEDAIVSLKLGAAQDEDLEERYQFIRFKTEVLFLRYDQFMREFKNWYVDFGSFIGFLRSRLDIILIIFGANIPWYMFFFRHSSFGRPKILKMFIDIRLHSF